MMVFRRFVSIFLLLLITSLVPVLFNSRSVVANPATIKVPEAYPTIQAAINAAQLGYTILVSAGTYLENVVVNKTISLVGENRSSTIIDGGGVGHVVNVTANDVIVTGFTLRNSGDTSSGVILDASRNTTISGNVIMNSFFAVWLQNSADNSVVSNTFFNNTDGVYMAYSTGNVVEGNIVANNTEGIRLEWFSNSNVFCGNVIVNNTDGIFVGDSINNNINGNFIANNTEGLFLNHAGFCTIYENAIANNTEGIFSFVSNGSVFYRNNFFNNTSQVFSYNSTNDVWDNGAEGNFWSDNVVEDLNGDGISDIPYVIDANNTDYHPLFEPWEWERIFDVVWLGTTYKVAILSNSTVGREHSFGFHFLTYSREIHFNVTGPSGKVGFFNVTVPKQLLLGISWRWQVFLSGVNKTDNAIPFENATHVSLALTYGLTTQNVKIINEPSTDIFPPVADAGSNQTVRVGDLVTFNASGSFDNVGIVSYGWDFGDGNVTTVSVPIITHVFVESGTYTVRLVVKDAVGNSASDTVIVTVLVRPETFPWWTVVIVVVVGVFLAGGVFFFWRKRRKL